MHKHLQIIVIFLLVNIFLILVVVPFIKNKVDFMGRTQSPRAGSIVIPDFNYPRPTQLKVQLHTFPFVTATPSPIPVNPNPANPLLAGGAIKPCYDGGGGGRAGVEFDEPEILIDYAPKPPQTAGSNGSITLWGGDENAIVLGLENINGTPFPISKSTTTASVSNPQIGVPYSQGGTDTDGRPMFPSLFLTDITNDPNSTIGDWQNGGTPIPPHFISGTWSTSIKNGSNISQSSLQDTKNVINKTWNLAAGGTAPVPGSTYDDESYYGLEMRWNIQQLLNSGKIQTGHAYRAQFMIRDGDGESDVAQGCVSIQI
jgi:hypothetical protein